MLLHVLVARGTGPLGHLAAEHNNTFGQSTLSIPVIGFSSHEGSSFGGLSIIGAAWQFAGLCCGSQFKQDKCVSAVCLVLPQATECFHLHAHNDCHHAGVCVAALTGRQLLSDQVSTTGSFSSGELTKASRQENVRIRWCFDVVLRHGLRSDALCVDGLQFERACTRA